MKKIKLAVISGYYPPGGVVTYVKNLYKHFGNNKYIDVTLFLNSPTKEYDKWIKAPFPKGVKLKIFRVLKYRFLRGTSLMLQLFLSLKPKNFDFIEVHHTSYANLIAPFIPKRKLIIVTHGPDVLDKRMDNPPYKFLAKRAYKKAYAIVSHTHQEIEKIHSLGIGREKLNFFPCGVDIEGIKAYKTINLRKELKIKNQYVLCTTYGTNSWRKGTHFLLTAIPELMREDLAILITGYMTKEFEEKAKNLERKYKGRLFLLGFRKDIPNILKNSDIYLLPSLIEGMSVSLLEAMAAGKACIATKGVGENDLSLEDCGILIKPASSKEIIIAVKKIIKNPSLIKKFGKKAEKRAKLFSWKKIAKDEENFLRRLK